MSKTSKQTDKIQEDRKSFCSDTEKIKHSKDYILEAMLDWACLHLMKQCLHREQSPVLTCCYSLTHGLV